MIKEAIDRILELDTPKILEISGRDYSERPLHPIAEPTPTPLVLNTLTGLVDYVTQQKDGDLTAEKYFIQIADYNLVRLLGALDFTWMSRDEFARAVPAAFEPFPFARFLDIEDFIIMLQARFVPNESTPALLKMASNIKDENLKISSDDGISQVVTVKKGAALVEQTEVPNPVILRPSRTFPEIEQPASPFIFRLRSGPPAMTAALFEADGGKWRLTAIQTIKTFLSERLPDVSVIA